MPNKTFLDLHMKKIAGELSRGSDENATGYITPEDLIAAFNEVILAVDEVETHLSANVVDVSMLDARTSAKPASLLDTLYNYRHVLGLLETMARINGLPQPVKGALSVPTVTGEPNPSTVAQVATVLNSLIESLAATGLVVDLRAPLATGIVGPTDASNPFYDSTNNPNNKQWAFTPDTSAIPANLGALQLASITPVPGTDVGRRGGLRCHRRRGTPGLGQNGMSGRLDPGAHLPDRAGGQQLAGVVLRAGGSGSPASADPGRSSRSTPTSALLRRTRTATRWELRRWPVRDPQRQHGRLLRRHDVAAPGKAP